MRQSCVPVGGVLDYRKGGFTMSPAAVEPIDLSKLLAKYINCWVAFSADERRVIATAKHPQQALKKAQAKGERDPILMWAPKEHSAYIV